MAMESSLHTKLLEALRWRYAVKAFDPEKRIDREVWAVLEDALVLTPSSFGLQPWKFLVVTDQATKEALVSLSWNQRQVAEGSHVVVFAVKYPLGQEDVDEHVGMLAAARGVDRGELEGFRSIMMGFLAQPADKFDMLCWASRQVYIALGNFMTSAALLGVDTCPMEGIQPAGYDKVLGLEGSGYRTLVVCVAGYRSVADKYAGIPKVRFPKERVVVEGRAI